MASVETGDCCAAFPEDGAVGEEELEQTAEVWAKGQALLGLFRVEEQVLATEEVGWIV